jgi:hypothetical protein
VFGPHRPLCFPSVAGANMKFAPPPPNRPGATDRAGGITSYQANALRLPRQSK